MMVSMETITSLCKRRGFIFQSSEIYEGLAGCWDFGPLGVELVRNVKETWWKTVVHQRDDMVGLDASILMHPQAWVASGHVENFTDPMVDCKRCKRRFRADHIGTENCPDCGGELTDERQFNLMFKTFLGPVEDEASEVYLRPETAQGIFVNFKNVLDSMRPKIPFGIAQIGKAFRNEITVGNFIFRVREFEQMEIEYFVKPGTDEEWHERWILDRSDWYTQLGIRKENLRCRPHEEDELAHYSKSCVDIEYLFPMGWSELEGIASRSDHDLSVHAKHSKKDLHYYDTIAEEHYVPYVIEPSVGVGRAALAFLIDAYREEEVAGRKRTVLRLHKDLAPIKVAVLPLLRNRPDIVQRAKEITHTLQKEFVAVYDDTAGIGRLYRRQDEIGTPYCVTVDVESLDDRAVTIRERDSMEQTRVSVDQLVETLTEELKS